MKIFKFELALILSLFITLTYTVFATSSLDNLSQKVIRFHVLANSDSDIDQQLKLQVKDEVFEYISNLTVNCDTNEQAFDIITENISEINQLAYTVIENQGFSYSCKTILENEYYPQKSYDNFSLPAGYYNGLKIEIGKAQGQNWWCVLFPPLCNQTAFNLKNLDEDDLDFISHSDYEFRFAFIDMFSNIKHQIND